MRMLIRQVVGGVVVIVRLVRTLIRQGMSVGVVRGEGWLG